MTDIVPTNKNLWVCFGTYWEGCRVRKEYRKYKFILCKTSLKGAPVFALLLPSNTWAFSGAPDKTNASAVELAFSRNALPKRTCRHDFGANRRENG